MGKSNTSVRVRFAPSPTGLLHLGGIRSALFNWLYAHKTGGTFILRFEDTDRERYVEEAADQIQESMRWLGIEWDEGIGIGGPFAPYQQSERLETYHKYAEKLVEKGAMYPCWCSSERLDSLRKAAEAKHEAFKYDRYCLTHPQDMNQPHVLRFKVPAGETISWDDAVRGHLEFNSDELDDFVAIKSDGFPTYNFANVIDDHLMEISHVFRGDEFIPTTPKNLLVYQAYDWQPPIFVHLPQVLGTDRTKLSKRHGAKSVLEYRKEGYVPEAVVNFLAALGWNEGEGSTKEIYTRSELVKAFSLERIQKSPAVFDPERLTWLNGVYIRSLSIDQLLKLCHDFWPSYAADTSDAYRRKVLGLVQDRLKIMSELTELTDFFFAEPLPAKLTDAEHQAVAQAFEKLQSIKFTHDSLEQALRSLAGQLDIKAGELFKPIRLAITGKTASPGLFETMEVLGKAAVLQRLENSLNR